VEGKDYRSAAMGVCSQLMYHITSRNHVQQLAQIGEPGSWQCMHKLEQLHRLAVAWRRPSSCMVQLSFGQT
jgi:hypothetical protein